MGPNVCSVRFLRFITKNLAKIFLLMPLAKKVDVAMTLRFLSAYRTIDEDLSRCDGRKRRSQRIDFIVQAAEGGILLNSTTNYSKPENHESRSKDGSIPNASWRTNCARPHTPISACAMIKH